MSAVPSFSEAPPEVRAEYDHHPPGCSGKHVGGSGGHRVHGVCGKPARWWHPDDTFAYCDDHVSERDRVAYGAAWARTRLTP